MEQTTGPSGTQQQSKWTDSLERGKGIANSMGNGTRTVLEKLGLEVIILVGKCIWETLKRICYPILVFFIFVFLLAIWGVHLFRGCLTRKCILGPENATEAEMERLYNNPVGLLTVLFQGCNTIYISLERSKDCPHGYQCVTGYGPNPYYGYENFDNIYWSYMGVLVIALNDFWEETCRKIVASRGHVFILYFLAVIFSSYCFYYTILAAIFSAFDKVWNDQESKRTSEEVKPTASDEIPFIDEDEQARAGSMEPGSTPVVAVTVPNDANQSVGKKIKDVACYWECGQCCTQFRNVCRLIVFDPFVQQFIVICLLVNVTNMACDHHNMTESFYVGLKHFRLVFLFVYVIEFVLKLIALSCLGYFKEGWNIFEFVIVFFGLLSHALESVLGLALLSVTNLLILFRLGRFWPTYNNTLRMMSRTTSVLLVFLLIIGSFLLIMASIGTSIFGSSYEANQYYFSDGIPRWHMMDYGHSFLLAFRCLCFEWVESLRDGMLVSGWSLFPFYFVLVVFGNFVLVNLFTVFQVAYIAIPYKNEEKDDKQVLIDNMSKTADRFVRLWKLLTSKIFRRQITYVRDFKERSQNTRISDANASIQVNGEDNSVINFDNSNNAFPELNQTTTVPETPENCCPNICYVCLPRNCGESPSFKKLREKCLWLINNIFFELVIIATVIINCALIVSRFEEFDKPSVTYKSLNYTLLVVFPLIFILETAIRLIGHGVKGYFSNGFRCWEFFFVIIYIVDAIALLAEMGHAPIAIIAISFRMFRLIGLTTRFEVARNVLNTFAEAFPGLMNVWIQGTFVWLIFAIMGVQMFGGKFYRCVDQFGDRVNATTIRDKYDCLMANLSWVNPDLHFDNVLDGYLSLSQVATFKGWINILHNAMDSKGVEDQPDEEVNFYMFVYFVLFIVCGSYFTYVMWFSVLIDAFNRQKRKTDEERNITSPEDELYYNAVKIMSSRNPNPPIKVSEGKNEAIVSSLPFDVLILILILLDVALLAMNHYQETESFSYGLTVTHAVFVTVYSIEIFLRALAQGFVPFLKKPTNLFDLAAILFIIIDLATANSISGNFLPPQFLRLGRVFDIISKYKWMKYFPGVRRIFSAGRKLLPYLGYLIFVETIIIFCYALMGVILWRDVRQFGPSGMFFNTLGESIVILSQIFVSSGWDGFLHPIMNERDCQQNENCGDKTTAILYLISFVTISYLVVMTLLTVLVQVMYSEAGDEELERLQNEQMDHFYRTWSQYDQDAKGYVDLNQLPSLLELQTNAFGFTKTSDSSVAPLDIPIVEGEKVHHRDVLDALFRWSLREKGIEVKNVEAFDQLTHPEPDYKPVSSTLWRKREENALAKIRKAWTQFKDQKL